MPITLSSNEEAQLAQTIEMFEVITQSQPYDYQSLEILKEAYSKLGRQKEVIATAKRIAEAYVQLGQLSSAILEYESILQQFPDDPDVQRALAEIENRASNFSGPAPAPEPEPPPPAPPEPDRAKGRSAAPAPARPPDLDDGCQMMRKIFVEGRLVSDADFTMHWEAHGTGNGTEVNEPFILRLAEKQLLPLDQSLKALSEKSRLAFLPIDKYEVDVELARTFPREVCMRWCVLPFDKMSKSVLVATSNPFNKQAAREIENATKNRLLWYLSPPGELMKVLRKVFR